MTYYKWIPAGTALRTRNNVENRMRNCPSTGCYPKVNVLENENDFELNLEIPGVGKEDISIKMEYGILTVAGEKKNPAGEKSQYLLNERYFGKFERSFTVSEKIDANNISASFHDGILTLTLPKKEEEKPKEITIK